MKVGDRVIYNGCPCIITHKWRSHPWDAIEHAVLTKYKKRNKFRLRPIEWDNKFPFLDVWVSEELLKIDYLYLRELKLKQLGI